MAQLLVEMELAGATIAASIMIAVVASRRDAVLWFWIVFCRGVRICLIKICVRVFMVCWKTVSAHSICLLSVGINTAVWSHLRV